MHGHTAVVAGTPRTIFGCCSNTGQIKSHLVASILPPLSPLATTNKTTLATCASQLHSSLSQRTVCSGLPCRRHYYRSFPPLIWGAHLCLNHRQNANFNKIDHTASTNFNPRLGLDFLRRHPIFLPGLPSTVADSPPTTKQSHDRRQLSRLATPVIDRCIHTTDDDIFFYSWTPSSSSNDHDPPRIPHVLTIFRPRYMNSTHVDALHLLLYFVVGGYALTNNCTMCQGIRNGIDIAVLN